MSGNGGIDKLMKEYMPGDDARADDSTQARGDNKFNFDAMFADEGNDPWWSQRAVHVPEAVSTAPASKDPRLYAKSEDDDDSDDNSDDDMHEGSDEASDDNGDKEQACPSTSKRQSPSYRVSVHELHERFKWTHKFTSDTQYLNLKDQQKKKIEKLEKNGRKFKKGLMGGIKKPQIGCKDWLDALMYKKMIGWRKSTPEQNKEGMEWVCTQIQSLHEYDKFFEEIA
jgi:hypothetical protein